MSKNSRYIWEFCAVLAVYSFSFWFVDGLVMPVQRVILPSSSEHICLLFIPHAVRLLTIWLYGLKGLIYMLIAAQFSYYFIYDNHPTTYFHFLAPFVAPLLAYLFLELFKKYSFDPYQIKNWKTLIVVGILSSFAHGYILAIIYGFDNNTVTNTLLFAFGDLNGLVLALILFFGYFKLERKLTRPSSSQ